MLNNWPTRIQPIAARALAALTMITAAGLTIGTAPILSLVLMGLAGAALVYPRENLVDLGVTEFEMRADRAVKAAQRSGNTACALTIMVDDFASAREDLGDRTSARLLARIAGRLAREFPNESFHTDGRNGRIDVLASPRHDLDTQGALQLANRMQAVLATPININDIAHNATVSVGYSLSSRAEITSGQKLIEGAYRAVLAARKRAPNTICADSDWLRERVETSARLSEEIPEAMRTGQIRAYFQPQISARTGAITGFEALARWQHPSRGLIPPSEFLPVMARNGQLKDLGLRIAADALDAITDWRKGGFDIPFVGINLSRPELSSADLVTALLNELDSRGLDPDCLCIEVLETVVANSPNDIVIENLAKLAQLGCRIDLDDFGTGHASITRINQFSVGRIKIDRSFVTGVDHDTEQSSMVAAILLMADRLGLETLAEGVETPEELATLTKMGCGHLQGFAIGRPMSRDDATAWISSYLSKTQPAPQALRISG